MDTVQVPKRVVDLLALIQKDGVIQRASELQEVYRLLAAHTAGAQEPVAWRYQSEDPLDGGEWLLSDTKPNRRNIQPLYAHPQPTTASTVAQGANVHTCALCGSTGDCKAKDPRLLNDCQGAWYRPAAHPQPMPQTDAARDAEDAKRYRFIKSQMKVGAVQTQLPLYRTLHWIGYEDCSDVHSADAAIDAEIERLDGAKGE